MLSVYTRDQVKGSMEVDPQKLWRLSRPATQQNQGIAGAPAGYMTRSLAERAAGEHVRLTDELVLDDDESESV